MSNSTSHINGNTDEELTQFRTSAAAFIQASVDTSQACKAFGAILPPALHDEARTWQAHMYQAGFAGIHWPSEFGGQGLSRDHTTVWTEECAKANISPYLNLQGIILAGEAILQSGTDEQRSRFLAKTASGEILWCQLFSEPNAGSDLASLQTTAVLDGDDFILNGQKVWTSNGQHAEYGILLARTDSDQASHRGISFFLLDMSLPGIDVRPLKQMTGDEEFCEVFLDDVSMPADSLLGSLHGGWAVTMQVLQNERGSSGSAGLISLERRLEHLGALPHRDGSQRDELDKLLVRGHALKTLLMRSDAGPGSASAAKLLRTELEFDALALETSLSGPSGMLAGTQTDRFLYSPGMRIAGGSSEIQRNIIGERVLGLPKEPRL